MSSKCSILNDTEHDVWVNHGINRAALWGTLGGLGVVFAGPGGFALFGAAGIGAGAVGAILDGHGEGGAVIPTEDTTDRVTADIIAGRTATRVSLAAAVTKWRAKVLSQVFEVTEKKAKKIKEHVANFQSRAKLIKPGKRFTFRGTLSLTMTVCVMNDVLQKDKQAVWTGALHGSTKTYRISKHFKKLDVKMKPEHQLIVYSPKSK